MKKILLVSVFAVGLLFFAAYNYSLLPTISETNFRDTVRKMMPAKTTSETTSSDHWTHEKLIVLHNEQFPEESCDGPFYEGLTEDQKLMVNTVSDSHKVFTVLCGVFAYQNSYVLYAQSTDAPEEGGIHDVSLLSFEVFQNGESDTQSSLIDPVITGSSLEFAERGRASADCGRRGVYEWSQETGGFELIEFYEKPECDGDMETEWPQVFEAEA